MNQNENNNYPGQWGDVGQQYIASPSSFSPPISYPSDVGHNSILAHQLMPAYEVVNVRSDDESTYHSNPGVFSPSDSPLSTMQTNYANPGMSLLRQPHFPPHTGHSSFSHSYSRSHSQVRPFAYQQVQSQSHHPQSRPRSHSQTRPYISSEISAVTASQHLPPHTPSVVPFSPSVSSQYPATPSRPFTCDLCTLSFSRQHDLKRHRETHTGEKPYLCNGGCGKTFTRKDALKRHQLVKACGKVDEAWP